MIGRVDDRRLFEHLRTSGRRIRRGPLTVTYVAVDAAGSTPLVAFAIGRRFGNAVQRNRARRRLRAAFDVGSRAVGTPLPVALLVGARPEVLELPFDQLVAHATGILRTASTGATPVR